MNSRTSSSLIVGALRCLPALIWMGVIYQMSAVPNSFNVTQHYFSDFNYQVRKWAHLTEFMVLVVLINFGLGRHVKNNLLAYATAFGAAFCYALSDEYHQSFVYGRSSSIADVAVDTAGALMGVAILLIKQRTD